MVMTTSVVITLALAAWCQTSHWRNSVELFEHTLEVTVDNHVIHTLLGVALIEQGKSEQAVEHFRAAVEIHPDFVSQMNFGSALIEVGASRAAAEHFRAALEVEPESALAHNGLGVALSQAGDLESAIPHFIEALRIEDGFSGARDNLERALKEQGHGA